MPDATKRYLAVIQFKSDTALPELAKRVPGLQGLISRLSNGETEQVFRTSEGLTFGVFFKSSREAWHMRTELDNATTNGDTFLIFEVGELAANKGFGRPATWLQRH